MRGLTHRSGSFVLALFVLAGAMRALPVRVFGSGRRADRAHAPPCP